MLQLKEIGFLALQINKKKPVQNNLPKTKGDKNVYGLVLSKKPHFSITKI